MKKITPYVIVLIVFVISFYIEKKENKQINKFKEQNAISVATITNYSFTGGGVNTDKWIDFIYTIEGVQYEDSKIILLYDCNNCIGKKYKIYYNKNNPKEAYIDLKYEVK